MSPVSKNATLVVAEDGTKTLALEVMNPVFTTQELGTCSELSDVKVERKTPTDLQAWTYGKYSSRISKITVKLTDDQVTGTKSYYFKGSKLYAVPLDTDIEPSGDIALELAVNYSSLPASALPDGVTPTPGDGDTGGNSGNGGGSTDGSGDSGNGGSNANSGNNGKADTIATTASGHYAAGTYTVSGNIWLPKSQTGLPLNPHLSNGSFPPKDAVSGNATMVVDSSGHAVVYIPIVIQSKVMTVNSIWGGASYSGGTAVIDLGYPKAGQTSFSGNCSVSVTIGDLAMTIGSGIFQGVRDHTYVANWLIEFGSASNAGGGGTIPASALAVLAGVDGVSDEASAEEAALAALDDDATATSSTKGAKSAKAGAAGEEDVAGSGSVVPLVALGAVAAAAVAALAWWLIVKRKRDEEEESVE